MSIRPTIKRIQARGIQRHMSAGQCAVPPGVMQAVLMHALQLRRNSREVFLLCDIQRHSISDAAEILGISRAVAHKRLRLARKRMDDVIERLCAPQNRPALAIQMGNPDSLPPSML